MEAQVQTQVVRAGFWRRAGAFLVDTIIIVLLLQVVAIAAAQIFDGRVRLSHGISMQTCEGRNAPPPGIGTLPFEPNYIRHCRFSLFGLPMGDAVFVGRKTQDGGVFTDTFVSFPVDDDGRLIRTFSLDLLFFPLLILFRWWQDRDWASPGRQATNIRIQTTAGERPAHRLTRRYALFALLWLPLFLIDFWLAVAGSTENLFSILAVKQTVTILTFIVIVVAAVIPIIRKRDAFYDRWAGTAVALNNPPNAEEPVPPQPASGDSTAASDAPR